MIARQSNMEHKKQLARELAGVGKSADAQKAQAAQAGGRLKVTRATLAALGAAVRIVFCGGCNPVIDRVALADELRADPGARRRSTSRSTSRAARARAPPGRSSSARAARRRDRRRAPPRRQAPRAQRPRRRHQAQTLYRQGDVKHMDWKADYAKKLTTADEALKVVRSGDRVVFAHACGEPVELVDALVRRAPELRDVEIVHMVAMGHGEYAKPEYAESFYHNSLFVGASTRDAVANGPRRLHAGLLPRDPERCSPAATCRPTWSSPRSRRPTGTAGARSASRSTTPSRPPRWPRRSSPWSTPTCRAPTATPSST